MRRYKDDDTDNDDDDDDVDIKHDGDKGEVSRGDSGKESHKDEDASGQICFIGKPAVSAPFSLR